MTRVYPIHFSQNAFIYSEQAAHGSWAVSFEFDLPTDAVQADERVVTALNQLLERHEALRYTFVPNPKLTQVEDPDFFWHAFHQVPTTRLLPPRGFRRYESPAEFPDQTRFRLTRPPYLRLHLADGDDGLSRARLDTHHVVADMWTYGVLQRDLTSLLVDGGAALPPVPTPYGRFAESDYAAFSEGRWEPSLEWWCRLLEDPPEAAWPATTGETGRAAWMTSITGAHYATFRDRLVRYRCTPFAALASSYARSMARVFDWDRLTLFVLYFNRRADTVGTVGQFSNIFYLPVTVSPAVDLGDLVRVVGRRLLEIIARHGHVWMKYVLDRLPDDRAARLTGAPTIAIREAFELPMDDAVARSPLPGTEITIGHKQVAAAQNSLEADCILDFVHTVDRRMDLVLTCNRARVADDDARQILADVVTMLAVG